MTEKLREELARIGDAAPRVTVSGDVVWARGRRARRRDRLVAGAAVLSVVAMLGGLGLVLGLPGREDAPPVSSDDVGAVPSVIHGVPERLMSSTEHMGMRWSREVAETDLAIGQASVAYVVGTFSLPVVVTAADGAYHPLALPGWYGASVAGAMLDNEQAIALSPDGLHLAWGWVDFSGEKTTSGIRVADLVTGDVRTVTIAGGAGVAAQTIVWSPDSRWIVWRGIQARRWGPERFSTDKLVDGRIAPGAQTSTPARTTRASDASLAIDSDGVASIASGEKWKVGNRVWFDLDLNGLAARGAFRPSGRIIAAGASYPEPGAVATFLDAGRGPEESPTLERPLAQDLDLYPGGAGFEPLGWIDDDLVVGLVRPGESDDPSYGVPHVVVMSAPTVPEDRWTYRVVARFAEDAFPINSLTVAVDLMTLEQPTRDFPEPEWPWSDERKWGTAALVVVPLVLLVLVLRQRRRNGRLA